jgi:hypothetical protein
VLCFLLGRPQEQILSGPAPALSAVLLVAFMLLVVIILLNVLRVIMTNDYAALQSHLESAWRLEQARVILDVELILTDAEKRNPCLFPEWLLVLEPTQDARLVVQAQRDPALEGLQRAMRDDVGRMLQEACGRTTADMVAQVEAKLAERCVVWVGHGGMCGCWH